MPSTHSRRRNFLSQMPTRWSQNYRSSIRLITMSAQKSVNNFKSSATSACSHSSAAARTIWLKRQFLPSRTYVGCPRCRIYTWVLGLTLRSLSCGCPRCRVYTWVLGLTSAESLQSIGEISRLSRKDPRLPSKRPDTPGFFHTLYPLAPFAQSSHRNPFTRANSFVLAVTSVCPRRKACPAINTSYAPIGLPPRSNCARTSPARRASSSSKSATRHPPPKKSLSLIALRSKFWLFAAPYHSSNATTDDTHICAPPPTTSFNRARTTPGSPLISAIHAF